MITAEKILVYTEDYGIGGVAQFNHSLVCKLATVGYQTMSVQTHYDSADIQQQKKLGVQHIWLDFDAMNDWLRTTYNQRDAETIFTTYQPDLIIFNDGWIGSNLAPKQVAIKMGIPFIIIIGYVAPHSDDFKTKDDISYVNLISYHYEQAQKVVAVSQENLELLQKMFNLSATKGKVIYYGRPAHYFTSPVPVIRQNLRAELAIPSDAVVCFTAARLTPQKGYLYQLKAIERLKNRPYFAKLFFVWAGAGAANYANQEPELRAFVKKLGVEKQVLFLGQRSNISDWLDASDLFILPSEYEGMPLAIMEAMAKGLPVIAAAVSGIPEELGETGKLLTDPKVNPDATINELVETIDLLAQDQELRQAMGIAARQRAEKMFTEKRMLREYLILIETVLAPENLSFKSDYTPTQKAEIDRQNYYLHYYAFVWNAWYCYDRGNLDLMYKYLLGSLHHSPFHPTENIIKWLESWYQFYGLKCQKMPIANLTNCPAWIELTKAIVTGETGFSESELLDIANSQPASLIPPIIKTTKVMVSVALPTYNGEQFLAEAIDSIRQQTLADFELIIVDDASTDQTPEIIKQYALQDNRIKYYQNPQRLGLFANWNRCLELAQGKYLTIFAQDDRMLPENLAEKKLILDQYPDVGLVASSVLKIDEKGQQVNLNWANYPASQSLNGKEWIINSMGEPNPICAPFVMLRRETLAKVGKFNTEYKFAGDHDLWLRLALVSQVYFLRTILGYYRYHADSETHKLKEFDRLREQLKVWSEALDRLHLPSDEMRKIESQAFAKITHWFREDIALKYIKSGNLQTALDLCDIVESWRNRGDGRLKRSIKTKQDEKINAESKSQIGEYS